VGLGGLDPVGIESPPVQESDDALHPGVGQETGGAGQVEVDR